MLHGWQYLKPEDRELILRGIEQGMALGGPFHVELDPVDACNAKCFFCNSEWFREDEILRWPVLGPVVEELIRGGLRSVRLAGGGEPLLYPDLPQLAARLQQAGVVLDQVTTNGLRLTESVVDHLAPLGPTHFMISLNYVNAGRYERFMRIPARSFEKVLDNIRAADRRLGELGRRAETQLHIQFFLHRSTIEDLDAMLDLAIELPVDTVSLRALHGVEEEQPTAEQIAWLRERLPELARRARGKTWLMYSLGELGLQPLCEELMRLNASAAAPAALGESLAPDPAAADPIEYCYIGWYSMVISGNGDAHPCCYLMPDSRIPPYGNITRQGVGEIWQGPMYRRHRQEMRRAMLLRYRLPLAGRRARCTLPMCWNQRDCPLAYNLADGEFYAEAHALLEVQRRAPSLQLARAGAALLRRGIDRLK